VNAIQSIDVKGSKNDCFVNDAKQQIEEEEE